ncbi:MAG: cytochrome P450 [Saccharothrix sp.]|nr:cytochrome P450 [Saccharothrix sp.]
MTVDEVDLLSPDALADPYPLYRRMREHTPVFWDERLKGWVVTRYEDVHAASTDPARYSSDRRVEKLISSRVPPEFAEEVDPLVRMTTQWVSMSDPPVQTRLRRHLQRAFNPRTVAALEPYITEVVRELLDAVRADVREHGRADLMARFAHPLPALIMADLFGFPRADAELLKRWWDALKVFFGGSPDPAGGFGAAMAGLDEMVKYFTAVVAEKRARPDDGFVSHLVAVDQDGGFLGDEELYANLVFVLGASYSTTMDLIGNGVHGLLTQHDQWRRLVDRPELAAKAVEEVLRFDGPVQVTQRVTTRGVELRGTRIAADESVFLVRGSANRDPARFPEPDRLDLDREPSGHVAFGVGAHYCVGAVLARMVGRIAFTELVRGVPDLRLDPSTPARWRADTLQFRGLGSLPVVGS